MDQEPIRTRAQAMVAQQLDLGPAETVLLRVMRIGLYCKKKDRWIRQMDGQ
ncbi:MAG: hypothetical protein HGA43_10205 [Nitrospirae bacterium]|nr:hypothetical protein [Nitrospirota bacterium]